MNITEEYIIKKDKYDGSVCIAIIILWLALIYNVFVAQHHYDRINTIEHSLDSLKIVIDVREKCGGNK